MLPACGSSRRALTALHGLHPRPLEGSVPEQPIAAAASRPHSNRMPPAIDLTDDEHAAVAALLRRTIDEDKFPLSPES